MPWFKWSQTANNNASADPTINWAEGQPPGSVNDSARAMMAASAMYRDDIAGAIVTTGTTTAYAVSSYSVFDTLAHLSGQMIAFTPHATNTAGPIVLNVDGLGFRALRSSPGVELLAGTIIQGTPYVAVYNNTDGAFYLRNFFGNPYNIPLAAGLDYWGPVTPNSCFAFPLGQFISRTTFATLFAVIGTTYGAGDGSTTFALPNKAGRVSAMLDPTGSILSGPAMSPNGDTLGAIGGEQSHTLSGGEMPTHNHGINDPGHLHPYGSGQPQSLSPGSSNYGLINGAQNNATYTGSATTGITIQNAGGGAAHNNVQPTISCNYIIRII